MYKCAKEFEEKKNNEEEEEEDDVPFISQQQQEKNDGNPFKNKMFLGMANVFINDLFIS